VAAPGFFVLDPSSRQFAACDPPSACRGGSSAGRNCSESSINVLACAVSAQCASGYTGDRCAACSQGWYRRSGGCEQCPRVTWVLLVVFGLALVALLGVANVLMRLGSSLAPLTIALDYFQVLGRFGGMDLEWSNSTTSLLSSFEVLELNVQFAAPECFVRAGFTAKWLGVQAVPVVCGALLAAQYGAWLAVRGRGLASDARAAQRERVLGVMLLMLQVLYITLVGTTLEAFDCNELPDGSRVLAADTTIECGGVEQSRLQSLGAAAAAVYVCGIPALFWWCLRRARSLIKAAMDRAARRRLSIAARTDADAAMLDSSSSSSSSSSETAAASSTATGSTARGKPQRRMPTAVSGAAQVRAAAQVRKQQLSQIEASQRRELQRVEAVFGCLYRRFTFESQFWLLVLMARKAAFVFAAVMLTTKPQSQSAILLLVLVASIVLQLVWRPYSRIDDPRLAQHQQQQRESSSSSSSSESSSSWVWSRAREAARRLRTDPNVMEASSLVSSSLVLLSGVLYSASRTEGLASSGWRGRSLDVSCAAIIAGSAGYMVVAVSVPVAMGLRDVLVASSSRQSSRARVGRAKQPHQASRRESREVSSFTDNPMLTAPLPQIPLISSRSIQAA